VWRLSPRILIGKNHPNNFVVPVFLNENKTVRKKVDSIIYVGFPSKDHALDILFEIAERHNMPLEIVGESAYLDSIRSTAPAQTKFHGYITDSDRIAEIVAHCFCGYAVYLNTGKHSYSYYGFASKTFHYLSNDVPVVTTSTSFFSEFIESKGIGHVVPPEPEAIERAILDIKTRTEEFSKQIAIFRQEWNSKVGRFFDYRMAVLLNDARK
jgi:glycosyltransferase involved in cell wall biosynthesis